MFSSGPEGFDFSFVSLALLQLPFISLVSACFLASASSVVISADDVIFDGQSLTLLPLSGGYGYRPTI